MVQRLGHYDEMRQKLLEAFEKWVWSRMERGKWTDKIKNSVVLERVGEGSIMLELTKMRKRSWLGHRQRRNCLLNDALEGIINEKKVQGRRRYQITDKIMINGLYVDTKSKAEKRVKCRLLSLK